MSTSTPCPSRCPTGGRCCATSRFRVGEGAKVALVGPNGTGKTTLLRIIAGDLDADDGAVTRSGGLGVMRQFVGRRRTTRPCATCSSPSPRPRSAPRPPELDAAELRMMERDDEPDQLRYAQALADWGDAGGYDAEALWDDCTDAALGVPYERAPVARGDHALRRRAEAARRSRRCCAAPTRCCCSTSRTTSSTCRPSAGSRTGSSSRPRRCCSSATTASCSPGRPPASSPSSRCAAATPSGRTAGGFATYHAGPRGPQRPPRGAAPALGRGAREAQGARGDVQAEGGLQLRHGVALPGGGDPAAPGSRRPARRRRVPREQNVRMRLRGGRTGKRAVSCERPRARRGLMNPFDLEVWYGERVAVLGSNGSGKSHFLRLLAAGGSDPDVEHRPVDDLVLDAGRAHRRRAARRAGAAGLVRADPRPPRAGRAHAARDPASAATSTGPGCRARRRRARWTATSWRRGRSSASSRSRAVSRRGCRSCCSSCPGPRCCCSTSRPTTSTWTRPRRWRRAWRPSRAPSSP